MNRIEREDHNIGSQGIDKTSLSSYDDKDYILKVAYSLLSHFHK